MELTELHPMLAQMVAMEPWRENLMDWYCAVADWLHLELSGPYTGASSTLRMALDYRDFPEGALDTETYAFHLLCDTVKAGTIAEQEVVKLGEYIAGYVDFKIARGEDY